MRTVYSCVVDTDPKYARQAVLWAASLLVHGEQEAESLVVHTIGETDPRLTDLLDSWGVEQVQVEPFDSRHPYSNKLVQFATPSLQQAQHVVLCDCDLAFAAPIAPWTKGDRIRARIVQRPWLPLTQWRSIFEAANIRFPRVRVRAGNGQPTLPSFCNGGLYVVPQRLFERVGSNWCQWDRWLLDHAELLGGPLAIFADQVSFTLACEAMGERIDYLPVELNYHSGTRAAAAAARDGRKGFVPRVLHYHSAVGPRGFLFQERIPSMNAATERVNQLIRSLNEIFPVPPSPSEPGADQLSPGEPPDMPGPAEPADLPSPADLMDAPKPAGSAVGAGSLDAGDD